MLSHSKVGSASGAAGYFASDNYYTVERSSEFSAWGGEGAARLGLDGPVDKDTFGKLLNSQLPDGTIVNGSETRRLGVDLTFSMPKSASILAYVSGDERILAANLAAVKETMTWAEKNIAEARSYERTKNGEAVRTGNLVYALFQHDTSRKLDPNGHIHAVVAPVTQRADGKWAALWNEKLFLKNATLGSIHAAAFREKLQALGYETVSTGKHGQFEIAGVSREVIEHYSQRRVEIVEKANELGISTPQGMDKVVLGTRDNKVNVDDPAALRTAWREQAKAIGFDGAALVAKAEGRADPRGMLRGAIGDGSAAEKPMQSMSHVRGIVEEARSLIGTYLRSGDELETAGLKRILLTPSELRTEMAVASSIRILGQREAAFDLDQIKKTALDLSLKGVTIERVDKRVDALLESGQLLAGPSERLDGALSRVTTPYHVAQERRMLAEVSGGQDRSRPIIAAADTPARLDAIPRDFVLSGEQIAAASLMLSASDRTVLVQGVAGAGKSAILSSVASIAADEGKSTLGLAIATQTVNRLSADAGIPAQTVSAFINAHLSGAMRGSGPRYEASKEALKDTIVVLDEASLVGTEQMVNLLTIANRLDLDRLVLIGDDRQLQAVDHGRPFGLAQDHGAQKTELNTSQRQKTEQMKAVAHLARHGNFSLALAQLGDKVTEAGNDYRTIAAERWLALSPEDRDKTPIYTTGLATRAAINTEIQRGLVAEGTIKAEPVDLTVLTATHATREELRHSVTYQAGQVLHVNNNALPGGLARGRYDVAGVDAKGRVNLTDENGRKTKFNPASLDPRDRRDSISLSERERIKLHEGDKILWTEHDKNRGLVKSAPATILDATAEKIRVRTETGDIIEMNPGDKMLERMGLAYAINAHQAQGMTSDNGIGVMHSSERNLANQRLSYVIMSRVRYDLEIITNDKAELARTVERNPGAKTGALDTIGEKPPVSQPVVPQALPTTPTAPSKPTTVPQSTAPAPSAAPGATTQREAPEPAKTLAVPEKRLDLTL